MSKPEESTSAPSRGGKNPAPLRSDSKKKLVEDARRNRFKDRAKDLERGVSTPALLSGAESATPKAPLPLNEEEVVTVGQTMGHQFVKKTFFQPTYCHYCADMLWGIKGQGYVCEVCNYVSHEKCVPFLKTPCRHVLADSIQSPVAHLWTSISHLKKKTFCNVCRKKISRECVLCEVCKYYSHKACKDSAFNDCKACATYAYGAPFSNKHHWIEGNLPASGRCQVCTKSCSSTDCLTSYRCGWCGMEVHSRCLDTHQKMHPACNFRDLWGMILQPAAISHRSIISPEHISGTGESPNTPMGGMEEDIEGEDDCDGGKGKPVIVVDGSTDKGFKKWRKTTVHPTYVTKHMTAQELLIISLRKCGISDNPDEYFLVEKVDTDSERELDPSENPFNIQPRGHVILRLYIRLKQLHKDSCKEEKPKGRMRIINKQLPSTINQVSVLVTSSTPVSEIIGQALIKFDLEEELTEEYCLVEVCQMTGVKEKVLANTDCPWTSFQELRRNSLTFGSRQRYYLRNHKGDKTSIYLGGVAKEILQDKELCDKYVKSLLSDAPEDLVSTIDQLEIGPAFSSLGGLIVTFPNFELAGRLVVIMEQHPDVPKITMLPTVFPDVLAINQEPVLVFINSKSGGNQGLKLLSAFRRHLNPHQVWDLSKGGPIPGLWTFRLVKQFRILIGGGDGTFGWVLSALQEIKEYLANPCPPSALLPLGTGNDLARALKWGAGYSGEKVMQILLTLEDANVTELDRWSVSMKEQAQPKDKGERPPSAEPTCVVMNNYLGVGLDAAIALDFHLAREENPEKFSSRLHNKGFYLQLSLQKMVTRDELRELRRHVVLTVDGNRVQLPDIAGLIVLNIKSWGAGADPWGNTSDDPVYKPSAHNDGLLEIVGVKSIMQMGQVQSGVRNAVRIAQGSEISIDLLSSVPVQVDGEAWAQPPSVVSIRKLPDPAIMLQGPDKATFSNSLSRKNQSSQLSLLRNVSSSGIELAEGLSSRRERPSLASKSSAPELMENPEDPFSEDQ